MLRYWTSHLNQTKMGSKSLSLCYDVGTWLGSLENLFAKEISTHCVQLRQNATMMLNTLKNTQQLKLNISRQIQPLSAWTSFSVSKILFPAWEQGDSLREMVFSRFQIPIRTKKKKRHSRFRGEDLSYSFQMFRLSYVVAWIGRLWPV